MGRTKRAYWRVLCGAAVLGSVLVAVASLPAAAQNYVTVWRTLFSSNLITANFEDAAPAYADVSDRYADRAARYLNEIEKARRACNRQSYEHNLRNLRALYYIAVRDLAKARGTRITAEAVLRTERASVDAQDRVRATRLREEFAIHDVKELEQLITKIPDLPRRCRETTTAGKQKAGPSGTKGGRIKSEPPVGIVVPPPDAPLRFSEFFSSRNLGGMTFFFDGGAHLGHSTFGVDPGAFVPVNETIRSGQGFFGGGIEVFPGNFLPDVDTIIGFRARTYFGDGPARSFNNGVVSGDVKHGANWSATGYIGFPQVINQPPGLPFQTLIITPTVGVTYQEDKLKSVQTSGGTTNIFDPAFGRVGATIGLNVDVPAGNFTYGLTTGLTMLPSKTVNGISSLGLPAQAQIDSQANFFIGGRVGVNLTDFQAQRTYRVGPGFRF